MSFMTSPPNLLGQLSGNDAGGLQSNYRNKHSAVLAGCLLFCVASLKKKVINPVVFLRNVAVVIKSRGCHRCPFNFVNWVFNESILYCKKLISKLTHCITGGFFDVT